MSAKIVHRNDDVKNTNIINESNAWYVMSLSNSVNYQMVDL